MAQIQRHHIEYEPEEWIVEIKGFMHRTLTFIQRTNPTPGQYAILTDFLHAVVSEWNRYRRELDLGDDV